MSEPFLGEIRPVAFNFAPRGWAFCNGQILPINQNQSLYSLLGTEFGGNGSTSFALPDLRGRVPLHEDVDAGLRLGDAAGSSTLSSAELQQLSSFRVDRGLATSLGNSSVASGTNPLPNDAPAYLTLNFCIALQGLFPSRN